MRPRDPHRHQHGPECYASNETGPLAYTPHRKDGNDRNLRNLNLADFWMVWPRRSGLTLVCRLEDPDMTQGLADLERIEAEDKAWPQG